MNPAEIQVESHRVEAAEGDERWRFGGSKQQPRWRWHAIDYQTGSVLADVFGRRKDEVFLALKQLLKPFRVGCFYTDYWGAYQRHLEAEAHCPGTGKTEKIERKHVTLRTRLKRLARKTIGFSSSLPMRDIVIGLFINRYEFGIAV